MSLSSCIRQAGEFLNPEDRAAILARAAELRAAGLGATEAGRQALQDRLGVINDQVAAEHRAYTAGDGAETAAQDLDRPGDGQGVGGAGAAPADGVRGAAGAVPRRSERITRGLGIAADIERTGHTALVGRTVRTPEELAELAQVYRDPRYETFRLFLVKGSTIVHATGMSSRSPSQVGLIPAGMSKTEYVARLQELLRKSGADGYYILHNHPSGDPTPSRADLDMTEDLAELVPGMRAHVVINSNRYSTITPPQGPGPVVAETLTKYFGEDKLLQASKPMAVLGRAIGKPDDLVSVGKSLQVRDGWITLVGTGADNGVRLVVEVPSSVLQRNDKYLLALVRRAQRQSGSQAMHAIGSDSDMATRAITEAVGRGVLRDAIGQTGQSLATRGVPLPRLDMNGPVRELRAAGVAPSFEVDRSTEERATMDEAEATELDWDYINSPEITPFDFGAREEAAAAYEATPAPVDDATVRAAQARVFAPHPETFAQRTLGLFRGLANPDTRDATRETLREYMGYLREKLVQSVFDQYRPILKNLSARAYALARMSTTGESTLEAVLQFGKVFMNGDVPDVRFDPEGGFLRQMGKLQGEHQRFLQWVAALRAERLKAQGRENLMSDEDIAALKTMDQGTMPDGSSRAQAYAQALATLTDYNDAVMKLGVDSGLINRKVYNSLKDDPYVPFFRVMEEAEGQLHWSTALTGQEAWKKLKGGTGKLPEDLMSNVLRNWSHVFTASAKNRAAVAALTEMEAMGAATRLERPERGSVWANIDGEVVHFQVHDLDLASAIGAITYTMPAWQKPLAQFKGLLTFGVTTLPDFKVRNLLRDTFQAMALDDRLAANPLRNVSDAAKTLNVKGAVDNLMKAATGNAPASFLAQNQTYASMLASGALMRFGNVFEGNRAVHAEHLVRRARGKAVMLDAKSGKRLLNVMEDTFTAYMEMADASEQVNRVALYEQMIAKGYSKAEAAFAARDLMDFTLNGKAPVIRFLVQSVPFLNARLQGLYKLGRAAVSGEKYDRIGINKRFANIAGSAVMLSLALMLAYQDDDDWKEREDWDRDAYWWFKIGDTAFRFPKPFEMGAIGTLAERTWEAMFDEDMTGRRYRERLAHMLAGTFSFNPTPQFIKPLIDVYANRDSFSGRAIESDAMQARQKEDRASESTTMVARALGQLGLPNPLALANGQWGTAESKLSPAQWDYMIGAYFGGIGTMLTGFSDHLLRPLAGEGEKPSRTLKQITWQFVDDLPAERTRYIQLFYDRAEQVSQKMASYKAAVAKGDMAEAQEIRAENPTLEADNKRLQALRRQLSQLSTRAQRIAADDSMSGDEKRRQLDALNRLRSDLTRRLDEQLEPF